MEVSPGQMTAIVGPSGGGKTSCVSLLKRLYEPQHGCILLDGQPLHSYQHGYLHQKVVPAFALPKRRHFGEMLAEEYLVKHIYFLCTQYKGFLRKSPL